MVCCVYSHLPLNRANHYAQLFIDEFSSVESKQQLILWRDSASEFRHYATGRDNVDGAFVSIYTKTRHDLLWRLYETVYASTEDRVVKTSYYN